ncbi:hypothetical protein LEMA_P037500.1 [Plenodomus lingam JN3]|uniref:Guanine nucleotide exchange factor Vps9 n=1 Tax=Leptosphaeria maculans (strain JN3 / isolate v23.1.3 / race Av1-4-5-6-7-8) TaxID=985895 RepID=E4ZQS1_LEPMJ|nr:hypothetical protein LEMA_P037500.1 [Plenodomus lingam JN3]CBX94076.1 hypothetical protein LEMA_P037500.1 [Plenodomus lingam JN3]
MSPLKATPQLEEEAPNARPEQKVEDVERQDEVNTKEQGAATPTMASNEEQPLGHTDSSSSDARLSAQAGTEGHTEDASTEATAPEDGQKKVKSKQTDEQEASDATGKQEMAAAEQTDAELVEELTAKTEAMVAASTPPPEPSTTPVAGKEDVRSPSPPPPPPKDDKYLSTSNAPSRAASPLSQGMSSERNSEDNAASSYPPTTEATDDSVEGSQLEIQSIMEQFESSGGPGADEIMSPRLELASPLLESASPAFPPRQSSLAPVDKPLPTPSEDAASTQSIQSPPPPRTSSLYRVGTSTSFAEPSSPSAHASKYKPAQPAPEPEPDLPFDFHRFLEQLRHRTADPVAKFLRSFLFEFGKKQWMVHEQVKIISDFLEFISKKMAQCEVWRTVSDAEFDNAREGMEKLVMNRLYTQTFSPAIPPPEPSSPRKGRRRQDPPGPGRRGQHQEDVERDEVLAQKIRIYKWVNESHLDIKPVGGKGRKFLHLAQQELLKIKSYRAPRDKIICILNCCKVIFGYLRTSNSDQSADAFVPLLIYTVLQANPDHLVSNLQYILRFRNQDKLGGEAGYYISSLMGAVQFIEGLDRTSLTISDEEFEKNVEAAVSAIAERHAIEEASSSSASNPPEGNASLLQPTSQPRPSSHKRMPSPHYHHIPEKTTPLRPELTQRNSMEAERAGPRRSTSVKDRKSETEPPEEENAAVAGLLRTIQRPLSTIGRIFSDNDTFTTSNAASSSGPASTPQPGSTPRHTPLPSHPSHESFPGQAAVSQVSEKQHHQQQLQQEQEHRPRMTAEESAARQASAEVEEARRIHRQEHNVVVETLAGMFPQLEREVIDDVVRLKEGRVGLAVDACLALANP